MPFLTETQAQSNPILKLAVELRQRTYGLCDIGVGPWGFGVNTIPLTKVGAIVVMEPDPYGEEPLPPEIKEYTVTIQPIHTEQGKIWYGKKISADTLLQFCQDDDITTRLVANALREMAGLAIKVSDQEDSEAYEALRVAEEREEERITPEEAQRLEELRWYETKTPEEIVDFQVCECNLCMPMERFRKAAEVVFDHPVTAETLDDCRMELLEERRNMKTLNTQQIGPVM